MKLILLYCVRILAPVMAFVFLTQAHSEQATDHPGPPLRYTLTDLGTLGGTFSWAFGVNDKGWVVGFATTDGDVFLHAFLWRNGAMSDLGSLGGSDPLPISVANGINNRGEIVGFSETSTPDPLGENFCNAHFLVCLPVMWKDGAMTSLPTLGGNNGMASDINNRGQVVGTTETTQPDPTCDLPQVLQFKPVLWENGVHELPTIPGDPDGLVESINEKGQIGGVTVNCNFSSPGHPVIWQKGKAIDITVADLGIDPADINNRGEVTGTGVDANGMAHAFLWKNGVATILETLPDTTEAHGNSINDQGQVEGQSCSVDGCTVFVWQNGVVRDLNVVASPGSSLFAVDSGRINARGQIVGVAFTDTGEAHAFLATPCDQENTNEGCRVEQQPSVSASATVRSQPTLALPNNLPPEFRQRLAHANSRRRLLTK